ncbi:uncharacterized protein LOC130802571 [Amaranthus tricolor]|uniref:uncharacterized protein LOC130802571 n=1 Tax=Amaranthus tricolor TaxID=29722 RepID=UPI00258F7E1C|nr:uncharacterized protein LOC130802571 [Amaranthus tricolor]
MHALNLVLDDLSMVSGLSVNKGKNALYFTGVDDAMSFKLVQASQVPKGVLPFRYLGVPLSAKRLGIQDCLVLVEKITSRINHWAARNLSLLDRLHLVRSVIQSMHSYWGQIFILPAKIVQMVKAMCNKFLWSSGRDSKAKSHVAWSHAYLQELNDCAPHGHFSMKIAYKKLLGQHLKVPWRAIWCNNKATPRSVVCIWQAILNRLPTIDRLWMSWNPMCRLCNAALETRDHLFGDYVFIWKVKAFVYIDFHWPTSFAQDVHIMNQLSKKKYNTKDLVITMS